MVSATGTTAILSTCQDARLSLFNHGGNGRAEYPANGYTTAAFPPFTATERAEKDPLRGCYVARHRGACYMPKVKPLEISFKFIWAPEGRTVDVISAPDIKQAKTKFYARHPQYRMYKGEVGVETLWTYCTKCAEVIAPGLEETAPDGPVHQTCWRPYGKGLDREVTGKRAAIPQKPYMRMFGPYTMQARCPLCDRFDVVIRMRSETYLRSSTHVCYGALAITGVRTPQGVIIRQFPRGRQLRDDIISELAA